MPLRHLALLLLTAYGFVIGGTWRICRQTWPELQETGDVNIARALEDLAKDKDGKKARKAKKKKRKDERAEDDA